MNLYINTPVGFCVAEPSVILEAARKLVKIDRRTTLSSPKAARDYLSMNYSGLEHEIFGCLWVDQRHRLIKAEVLFRGTIDGASVYPREVVKSGLAANAAAVMLFHNHPSGIAEPSTADETITARLKEALSLMDMRVLDHFIIGAGTITSFAERGLL